MTKLSQYKRGLRWAVCRGYENVDDKDWCGNYEHDWSKEPVYIINGEPVCESCAKKIFGTKFNNSVIRTANCLRCHGTINLNREPSYFIYGEVHCSKCVDYLLKNNDCSYDFDGTEIDDL